MSDEPEWIEWGGGSQSPVGGQGVIEIQFRDAARPSFGMYHRVNVPNQLRWTNSGGSADIVRFRVISGCDADPYEPQQDDWVIDTLLRLKP